ncbi:MAG: histidine kinase, partial [Saprospiraceae bacterium]
VSKSKHLTIDIYIDNQYIIVSNNLQKKKNVSDSSGIGLANIQARYQYIAKKEVIIEETEKAFIVKIPLLDFE